MESVTGIGGFFFVANDPDGLAHWYADMLGVTIPVAEDGDVWTPTTGPCVFSPSTGSDHMADLIGPHGWGINFRVGNLDAMVTQLRAHNVEVRVEETEFSFGRFAFLTDPEGNPIQLWENWD